MKKSNSLIKKLENEERLLRNGIKSYHKKDNKVILKEKIKNTLLGSYFIEMLFIIVLLTALLIVMLIVNISAKEQLKRVNNNYLTQIEELETSILYEQDANKDLVSIIEEKDTLIKKYENEITELKDKIKEVEKNVKDIKDNVMGSK